MRESFISQMKEIIQEAEREISKEMSVSIPNGRQDNQSFVYQSRLLKEDELSVRDTDSEHPEHEGACEQSPEGVEGDSDEGEYQPSLKAVPTEENAAMPSEEDKEKIPENLLEADAPPMQKHENPRPHYQITLQELRKSIITAEILGKPMALRKKYR